MRMIKVALFSPLPPPTGGMATWSKTFLHNSHKQSKYKFILYNTAMKAKSVYEFNITKELIRNLKLILNCIFINVDIEIVHINSPCDRIGLIRDLIMIACLKLKRKKIIFHIHTDISRFINNQFRNFLIMQCIKMSSITLVLNNDSKNYLNSKTKKNIMLLNNFICPDTLANFKLNQEIDKLKTICYIGHFTIEKGAKLFLEVAEQMPHITFNIYGAMLDSSPKFNHLRNVVYKGNLKRNDLFTELKNNDILLFTSYREGSSLTLLECVYLGLPVLTTKNGNVEDYVDGNNIVDHDVSNIVTKLNTYTSKDDFVTNIENNRRLIDHYYIDTVINDLINIYSSL